MALRQQIYAPDTCRCQVLESWDDSVPEAQRVHTLVAILYRGEEHASIVDDSLYSVLREENTRKNIAVGICVEEAPELGGDAEQVAWTFTPGRTLHLSFPTVDVNRQTKEAIQTACDTQLGLGLVVIE